MAGVALTRAQVLAFRATGHGLAARRPAGDLVGAAAAIGLRRTSALDVALAARVEGVTGEEVARAIAGEALVAVYGARGTVMVVPPADVAVFTLGAAPADEASLRAALPGAFLRRLDGARMSATDAQDAVVAAIAAVLASGPLPRAEVATEVTAALPQALTPPCRGRCPDPHVEDSLFRLAGARGAMRFVGGDDTLIALGGLGERSEARRELVGRYLRCHGPSTARSLADWMGVSVADARRSLAALGDTGLEVRVEGREAGVMAQADVDRAQSAEVHGVRFLPPFDAYLLDRDRDTLVPDRAAQRTVWRASGNPGVVLVDAEPVATWRNDTRAGRPTIVPLPGARPVDRATLEKEDAP